MTYDSLLLLVDNLATQAVCELLETVSQDAPLLPTLRMDNNSFKQGQDVMVYVGKAPHPSKKYKCTSDYLWVCGKVLSLEIGQAPTVHLYLHQPIVQRGYLDCHYYALPLASPRVFSREDFFSIRTMNPDSTFMKIFFENCDGFSVSGSIEQWNDPEEIGGILTDEHVEPTTEVDLSNTKVAILKEMLELTIKNNLFVNEASQISNIFETRV